MKAWELLESASKEIGEVHNDFFDYDENTNEAVAACALGTLYYGLRKHPTTAMAHLYEVLYSTFPKLSAPVSTYANHSNDLPSHDLPLAVHLSAQHFIGAYNRNDVVELLKELDI